MGFLSLVPQSPLRHLVESIWDWQGARQPCRLERVLPVVNAGLIINLAEDQTRVYDEQRRCLYYSAMTLDGPRNTSSIIDTDEQVAVMGVVFRPAAAAAFFRERMDALANTSANLQDLAGNGAVLLREQLLHAPDASRRLSLLGRWLSRREPVDSAPREILHALSRLDADPRVATLKLAARELGLSPRLLADRFRQAVGFTPKRYLRLRRFQRVLAATTPHELIDWAGIAADCGYSDQAHLSHEFRAFSGITPGRYARHRGDWSGHIAVD